MDQTRLEDIHIDTKVLRYIIAIVDESSLTQAATKLYLSQPALSRHLSNVESLLGSPIFYRSNNKLQLTDTGKIFINGARSILYIEDQMLKDLRTTKQDRQSSIYVAAEGFFYDFLKARVEPLFSETFPNITLFLTKATGNEVRRLTGEGFSDIGFYFGTEFDEPLISCETLFKSQLMFCIPERSIPTKHHPSELDLSLWNNEAFILSNDLFLQELQQSVLKHYNIFQPKISCTADLGIILTLLNQGYGNVLLPQELITHLPPHRKLKLTTPVELNGIFVCNKRYIQSEPINVFVSLSKSVLQQFSFPVPI